MSQCLIWNLCTQSTVCNWTKPSSRQRWVKYVTKNMEWLYVFIHVQIASSVTYRLYPVCNANIYRRKRMSGFLYLLSMIRQFIHYASPWLRRKAKDDPKGLARLFLSSINCPMNSHREDTRSIRELCRVSLKLRICAMNRIWRVLIFWGKWQLVDKWCPKILLKKFGECGCQNKAGRKMLWADDRESPKSELDRIRISRSDSRSSSYHTFTKLRSFCNGTACHCRPLLCYHLFIVYHY